MTALNFVGGKRRGLVLFDEIDPDRTQAECEKEIVKPSAVTIATGVWKWSRSSSLVFTLRVGDKMAGRHGNKGVIRPLFLKKTCHSSG